MTDQDQKLCATCHERPGTNHICYGGEAREARSLCDICLKQDPEVGGLTERLKEAVRVGHCEYCGAPAETGSGRSSPLPAVEHFNLRCRTCEEDLDEFDRRPENAFRRIDHGDEVAMRQALMRLSDTAKRRDEFIRQRVLARKST